MVEEKLKNAKLIDYIIEAVPAFGLDPIAINILTDRHLLWKSLGKKKSDAEKTLSDHPSLGYAVLILQGALNDDLEEKKKFQFKDSRALYNIDQMSDDDDEDDEDDDDDIEPEDRRIRSNNRNPFTRLIRGPGMSTPYGNNAPPSQLWVPSGGISGTSSTQQPNMITNDFFRQAMLVASGLQQAQQPTPATNNNQTQQSSSTPIQPSIDPNLIETQLQQLREMGITDEDLARRVLMDTGADLQATIEILFSDMI